MLDFGITPPPDSAILLRLSSSSSSYHHYHNHYYCFCCCCCCCYYYDNHTLTALVRCLVGLIAAVVIVITRPALWDALAVVALELPGLALPDRATGLVGAVPAVVRTVAQLERVRAVQVHALELTGWTVAGSCKTKTKTQINGSLKLEFSTFHFKQLEKKLLKPILMGA